MKIIDCFPFFNELDLLEIRLNSLAPYVERFVLCECPVTHTGNPKPLYYQDNKERFRDFNITHLVVKDYERFLGTNAWNMEKYQRMFIINGIRDEDPETVILVSDLDEIPDMDTWNRKEGYFRQHLYYYYLNAFSGRRNWHGTMCGLRKNVNCPQELRDHKGMAYQVGTGWHFSTLGTVDQIVYKMESFGHVELNTPERKAAIPENRKNLVDPYNRAWNRGENPRMTVRMPSGPKWLLDNKDKYPHLFWKEVENA